MLARYLAGESSAEETARVRQWLDADPARVALMKTLGDTLDRLPGAAAADVDVEAALRAVKARRFEERSTSPWRSNLIRIAAAIIVVLGASLVWQSASRRSNNVVAGAQLFQARPGQTDSLTLADGTHVVLGPGSALRVANGYGTRARNVDLNGEALFDVVHDSSRPFAVHAGDAVIRDVGTRFAVRGNIGEDVHVAVTAGSVVLHATNQPENSGVVLHAGEHGVLARNGQATVQPGTQSDDDMAWTRGELVFDDASIEHVAIELKRWYGIDLRSDDASLTDRHVTASFKGESADEVLRVIGLTLGVRIERNGDTAIIHSN